MLTYIGFGGISTLSEEVHDPQRNILRATVLICLITGVLASLEVYAAQLIWPYGHSFPDMDTAFSFVAGRAAAGPGYPDFLLRGVWLFQLVNLALLVASIGPGSGAQLGAARLLYGMGRSGALPPSFFGKIDAMSGIPRNNVILVGAITLAGAFLLTYQLSAELLNFGALIAFTGVNLAAFRRYFLRGRRTIGNALPPLVGTTISLYLWLSLRTPAKIADVYGSQSASSMALTGHAAFASVSSRLKFRAKNPARRRILYRAFEDWRQEHQEEGADRYGSESEVLE